MEIDPTVPATPDEGAIQQAGRPATGTAGTNADTLDSIRLAVDRTQQNWPRRWLGR